MIGGFQQFLPPGLPQQVERVSRLLEQMAGDIADLKRAAQVPDAPDLEMLWLPLSAPSGTTTAVNFPEYAGQLRVVAIWLGSSYSGIHTVAVGQQKFNIWNIANTWQERIAPGRLIVPRGVRLSITPGGAAQFDAVAFAYPTSAAGKVAS